MQFVEDALFFERFKRTFLSNERTEVTGIVFHSVADIIMNLQDIRLVFFILVAIELDFQILKKKICGIVRACVFKNYFKQLFIFH